jgi:hypothetical protein
MKRKWFKPNKLLIDIFGDSSDARKVVDEAFGKMKEA